MFTTKSGQLIFKGYRKEFIIWLTKELINNNIDVHEDMEYIENILNKHIYEIDNDNRKSEILNEILNCPTYLRRTRKEKIRQLKIKAQIQKQFDLYSKKNEI